MLKTLSRFVERFDSLIVSQLSCFDRIVFKGHLPLRSGEQLERFVDHVLRIRRKDFPAFAEARTEELVAHAKRLAQDSPGGYQFHPGRVDKDRWAQQLIAEHRIVEGLVGVLCVMETCGSFRLTYGEGRPRLARRRRQQRVLYFYYLDARFGLMHVRLQTWFPFTFQVCLNGHEWLARQLQKKHLGFVLQDNAFIELDDPEAAQRLADRFVRLDWTKVLDKLARHVNPLITQPWMKHWNQYYWVADQAEYATDMLFKSRSALAQVYPQLLDHALLSFSPQDVLRFLGRRLHPRFDGEVITDCKKDRLPGARIKHRVKNNWLKMYDKFGQILRIETVINNPREFKVRRRRERRGQTQMVWCPMNKGVANLYRYQQVAHASNGRYAAALALAQIPSHAARRALPSLAQPKTRRGRRYAGFNPARPEHVKLFAAVLDGDHLLRGFQNRDIRQRLWPVPSGRANRPASKTRRCSRIVTRLLKRLHVRGLIVKVPHSRRWHVTEPGRQLLSTVVKLYRRDVPGQVTAEAA